MGRQAPHPAHIYAYTHVAFPLTPDPCLTDDACMHALPPLKITHQNHTKQVRAEFRRILMNMGFVEMPTNRWVESSFWNFDALFQPQVGQPASWFVS